MKRSLTLLGSLLLTFLLVGSLSAQTTLGPGDIAFTLMNMEGQEDDFTFVLLKDVVANTTITFTDDEFFGSSLNTGEGRMRLTFNSAFTCGTEFVFVLTQFNPLFRWSVTAGGSSSGLTLTYPTEGFSFSSGGDNCIAFQDASSTTNNPARYLAAINN